MCVCERKRDREFFTSKEQNLDKRNRVNHRVPCLSLSNERPQTQQVPLLQKFTALISANSHKHDSYIIAELLTIERKFVRGGDKSAWLFSKEKEIWFCLLRVKMRIKWNNNQSNYQPAGWNISSSSSRFAGIRMCLCKKMSIWIERKESTQFALILLLNGPRNLKSVNFLLNRR